MRAFSCPACGGAVFFHNSQCLGCGTAVGYHPAGRRMARSAGPGAAIDELRDCARRADALCNWLVPAVEDNALCRACRLTRTLPDLSLPGAGERLAVAKEAKRRLIYGFDACGLDAAGDAHPPMLFDLLADPAAHGGGPPAVVTGHKAGVITINLEEADPVHRERARSAMDEPYRTLLGHFRHESGHFFWPRLVGDRPQLLERFRALFGDERDDYAAALQRHHAAGGGVSGPGFISAYAAAHPHEDWAETWAHLLHMLDILETAVDLQLSLARDTRLPADLDPWQEPDPDRLLDAFVPMTAALNELNRSIGQGDAYPFVITDAVRAKLAFAHAVMHQDRR